MADHNGIPRCIGILTAGGDCPGLNAAIRAVTKAAIHDHDMKVLGIEDGFRGLVENRMRPLAYREMSGILSQGGTILGTSRDKPNKMPMGGKVLNMVGTAVENARTAGIDCLVCLGGGGTQKNALLLAEAGLNVITLPKTIDNDVGLTDASFGFDTALSIATNAIDRLHTTATSHDRIILVETMGHRTGWIALGSGVAGGADVILIPEIPYDIGAVAEYLLDRQRRFGRRFSIVAIAEGALSREEAERSAQKAVEKAALPPEPELPEDLDGYKLVKESLASRIAREVQGLTRTEARVTALGHVQRGGSPTARDRLLATKLGTRAVELMASGTFNVMVAERSGDGVAVPLTEVAGVRNMVPLDHPWIRAARTTGTNLGIDAAELDALVAAAQAAR
ncbi:6-phosphofructokinase [bacterium]|nr:6-phosphofructokinase [bacterium]